MGKIIKSVEFPTEKNFRVILFFPLNLSIFCYILLYSAIFKKLNIAVQYFAKISFTGFISAGIKNHCSLTKFTFEF